MDVIIFAIVKINTFCNIGLFTVQLKFLMEDTRNILFSNRNDNRNPLLGCSIASSKNWLGQLSFEFVNPISTLIFVSEIFKHLLVWSNALRNSQKLSKKEPGFFWNCSFFLGRCPKSSCFFKAQKWNNMLPKNFCSSLCQLLLLNAGTGDVKRYVKIFLFVQFVQELIGYFFVREKQFARTGSSLSVRYQLLSVSKH